MRFFFFLSHWFTIYIYTDFHSCLVVWLWLYLNSSLQNLHWHGAHAYAAKAYWTGFLLAPLALTILRMRKGHAAESEAPEASHKLSHENLAVACEQCTKLFKHLDKLLSCLFMIWWTKFMKLRLQNISFSHSDLPRWNTCFNCLQIRTCQLACAQLCIWTQPTLALLLRELYLCKH